MINNKKVFAIIMAGGKGTRIGAVDKPKVMFEVANQPIIGWAIKPFMHLKEEGVVDRIITVVGFHGDKIVDYLGDKSEFVWQEEQLGTAHAVKMAENLIANEDGITIIVNGDHALYSWQTYLKMLEKFVKDDLTLAFAVVKSKNRFNDYGRVVRNGDGSVREVIEVPEATPDQLLLEEKSINLYAVDNKWLFESLPKIKQSSVKKEYYIVDIVKMAIDEGRKVEAVEVENEDEALGINTLEDRAEVERILTK